jgi:glycosyltransferase involved in cell wall biosynthesis
MRVCHVVNAVGETTGPADHAVALQKHTGVDVGVLAWFKERPFDGMEIVETHCLHAPDTELGIDLRTLREARRVLGGYDVVHTHHPHSATYAKLVGRLEGAALVFTSGTDHGTFTRRGRVANGLTNALVDRMTCVSPSVRDSMKRWERVVVSPDSIQVVYTGVDLSRTRAASKVEWDVREAAGVAPETALVGHAARLTGAKGQDTLIRGFARARERLGDGHLLLAGDGDIRADLERIAREEEAEDHVTFLGLIPRERAYRLMANVDVFAMPSRWEGFSSSAVEAMALGTACVFSDIPSLRDPFDGVARFHPVDDPDALAGQLVDLLSDEEERSRIGDLGRERVEERFTMEATAREYARIYREITGK